MNEEIHDMILDCCFTKLQELNDEDSIRDSLQDELYQYAEFIYTSRAKEYLDLHDPNHEDSIDLLMDMGYEDMHEAKNLCLLATVHNEQRLSGLLWDANLSFDDIVSELELPEFEIAIDSHQGRRGHYQDINWEGEGLTYCSVSHRIGFLDIDIANQWMIGKCANLYTQPKIIRLLIDAIKEEVL